MCVKLVNLTVDMKLTLSLVNREPERQLFILHGNVLQVYECFENFLIGKCVLVLKISLKKSWLLSEFDTD